jgi:hypothetical protein
MNRDQDGRPRETARLRYRTDSTGMRNAFSSGVSPTDTKSSGFTRLSNPSAATW